MMELKVCGITNAEFAVEAARRGVDYLGLIFAAKSPRRVTPAQARGIAAAALERRAPSPAPRFVGVFVEQTPREILEIAKAVPLNAIQLHSQDYDADAVATLKAAGLEIWALDGSAAAAAADATLLDGRDGARCGGTGKLADWSRVAELKRAGRSVVLAGGISASNAAEAAATGADVIDVNSSIETSPGHKDAGLLDGVIAALPKSPRRA